MKTVNLNEYPKIEGTEVVFIEFHGDGSGFYEERRELKSLVLEGISEEDFDWLNSVGKGYVGINAGYQGYSKQNYELVRNPTTNQVALKWQGDLRLDPLKTTAPRFYDGLTREVERLQYALQKHREGQESGWGDTNIPDSAMPR